MQFRNPYPVRWRQSQAAFKKAERRKYFLRRLVLTAAIAVFIIGGLSLFYFVGRGLSRSSDQTAQTPVHQNKVNFVRSDRFSRQDLMDYLSNSVGNTSGLADQLVWDKDGARFRITTTIDSKLQRYTMRLLRSSMTLQSAVVVLNPYDGRVLTMASRDKNGNRENLCLKADFPAASLFKIVSAAAALETAGYSPDKALFFNGSRHTLYKYQLSDSQGRYSMATTFRKAFAVSNNSVFGKIGIYELGQKTVVDYAEKFRFNRSISFDLPVEISTIEVPGDEFGLAEITSGFNKKTLLSPLHAALLASVAVNRGRMPKPWIVRNVSEEMDEIVYQGRRSGLDSSINSKTAADLKVLMQDAARYGTGRTTFRKLRRQRTLKGFDLGAKTGTINDRSDRFKYDWIVAFAVNSDGSDGICVGILSVHGKLLGTRATELARAIIDYHFAS